MVNRTHSRVIALFFGLLLSCAGHAQMRDQMRITGSSTLYPFSTSVAEEFGRISGFDAPIVEGIGTGGGMKLFCAGLGASTPDIVNASRRIKPSEIDLCARNGVIDIVEIKIGYDGIVLANTKESSPIALSLREIYLALAAEIPKADGTAWHQNPHMRWSDIRPDLPDSRIAVLGPPPTSGTRDAFNELALMRGCDSFAINKALETADKRLHQIKCQSIREDGVFIEAGENDNLIVQKLQANWDAVGIFGFSFLDQNSDVLQPVSIKNSNGTEIRPSFDAIADGNYPVFRSLYFYLKKAHIRLIPGMREYLAAFTKEEAWGEFGYLTDRGLIPLSADLRAVYAEIATNLKTLDNLDDQVKAEGGIDD